MNERRRGYMKYFAFVFLLILVACGPRSPRIVFVTPTPDADLETVNVDTYPTVFAPVEPEAVQSDETSTVAESENPIETLPPVTKELVIESPTEEGTSVGAIIGEDYTLPPTNTPFVSPTPLPTETPIPSNTPIPSSTSANAEPVLPSPILDPAHIGIQLYNNFGVEDWQVVLELARQLRVQWIKIQANWAFLQPDHAGQFDQSFRLFQLQVQDAKKKGFNVLISVVKAPNWSRNVNRNESGPPDDPNFYTNFLRILLDKVGPHIDAIEIWNEPNLRREWTGSIPFNGEGYMRLFAPAYQVVREYSPSIVVVTAGLAPTGNSSGSIDDREFLRQMYDAGLGNYQDIAIGVHPYSWGNAPDARCCNAIEGQGWDDDPHFFFSHTIEDYREIMMQRGHSNLQLWITEFGWATWDGLPGEPPQPWMIYNTPEKQLQYTLRAFEIGQQTDFMGPMLLWNLNFANDTTVGQRNEIVGYSLLLPPLDSGKSIQTRPLYWGVAEALSQ